MAITTLKLWMAPESNRLLAGPSSFAPAQNPVFYEGNTARIELHILAGAGVGKIPYEVAFPAGAAVKLAVGQVNAFPTSGTWQLMVNNVETADMPFNATPAQVQTALNALSSVQAAGGVTCAQNGDGYTITWNTYGTKPDIGIGSDTLVPSSYESISLVQQGTADNRKVIYVELRQAPVALGVDWDPLPAPQITVSQVAAWNGTTQTWRFGIEPAPKAGSYNLTVVGSSTKSYNLSYSATADNITTAISKDFTGAKAYKTGEAQFDIVFNQEVTITADGNALIGYLGYIGNVNFSTAEVHQFIGGLGSRSTTLEVAIDSAGIPQTLIQVPCFVSSDVISNGVLQPLPLGTAMSEQVANARFVRRDLDQNPDAATQDVIWQNLGVETLGSDIASALSQADSPSASNPFATKSDIPTTTTAHWGDIAGNLDDQIDLRQALQSKYPSSNPSGFIPEANVDGNLYGRKNGQWEVVPSFSGGLVANPITMAGATTDTEMSGDYFGIELSSDHTQFAELDYNQLNISGLGSGSLLQPGVVTINYVDNTGGYTDSGTININQNIISLHSSVTGGSPLYIRPSGITFPDGSVQSVAVSTAGLASESWVTSQGYTTESWVTSQGYTTESWVTGQGYATESFVTSQGYLAFDTYNRLTFAGGTNPDPSPLPGRFWFQSDKFRYSTSYSSLGNVIASESWVQGLGYATQSWVQSQSYLTQSGAALLYAPLSGATFTGKINATSVGGASGINIGIGGTNTSSTVNGDLWIATGGTALNFRDGQGTWRICTNTSSTNTFSASQIIDTTSTTAALRVTQKGTGNAIEIEDSATPDATRFVVDQFGKVGVGVAPDATAAIKVDGNGISFNGVVINPTGTASHTNGAPTLDLLITINGTNYRIDLRPA